MVWWKTSTEDERRSLLAECVTKFDSSLASKPYHELTSAQQGAVNSKYHERHADDD
jgi:hypothetical protein